MVPHVAIIIGIFVFLLTGAMGSEVTHDSGGGIMPGLVLGVLAAYPIFKAACEERAKFLHPEPREYNVPAKTAFAKIREILAETSYNYGDKWNVVTADTLSGRTTANLRFMDEFTRFEGDARGNIHTRGKAPTLPRRRDRGSPNRARHHSSPARFLAYARRSQLCGLRFHHFVTIGANRIHHSMLNSCLLKRPDAAQNRAFIHKSKARSLLYPICCCTRAKRHLAFR